MRYRILPHALGFRAEIEGPYGWISIQDGDSDCWFDTREAACSEMTRRINLATCKPGAMGKKLNPVEISGAEIFPIASPSGKLSASSIREALLRWNGANPSLGRKRARA